MIGNFLSWAGGNPSAGEELAAYSRNNGFSIITSSKFRFRLLRIIDMLYTVWRCRKKVDVTYVEVYSGLAFYWAETVCRTLRVFHMPYILALHGGNLPSFARLHPARVEKFLSSANIVTSPSRYLQAEMSLYRSDILVIPNPLDIKNYPYRLRSNPVPRLIWLRAFHKIYNPQMAIQTVNGLVQKFPAIELTMIGPDKGDGALQEIALAIRELGLHEKVRIIPGIPKSEVPAYLEQFDIFINTTTIDNTPVSVLEAMACGLCLVSTDVGGLKYLLKSETNALLIASNNPRAMEEAVFRLLTEDGLASRLSHNARQQAVKFDWQAVFPQWEKLFNSDYECQA